MKVIKFMLLLKMGQMEIKLKPLREPTWLVVTETVLTILFMQEKVF